MSYIIEVYGPKTTTRKLTKAWAWQPIDGFIWIHSDLAREAVKLDQEQYPRMQYRIIEVTTSPRPQIEVIGCQ